MSVAAPGGAGATGSVIAPPGRLARAWRWLRAAAADAAPAQAERVFLWTPVAFGCGAAVYMTARSEPPLWLLAAVALAGVALAIWGGRRGMLTAVVTLMLACGACGALVGGLRTRTVAAPVVTEGGGPRLVEGWVVDVDSPGSAGPRLVLAPTWIQGVERLPARVRIGVEPERLYGPGAPIRARALLNPPPGPAAPGTYDFARDGYFRRLGAVGYAVSGPEAVSLRPPGWGTRLAIRLNAFRWALSRRIVDHLGPERGGVAAAMVTGHEAWVSREVQDAMRDSGLAHVLSISGLHMAIVGGFVFFAVRAALAAVPAVAERLSTKKAAAVAGLIAVGAYLALSGAPPPAVRAAVTASVAFCAILAGRRAVTLRALAFAALLVLALQPEAVLQPGFQMSFSATAALVALAEAAPQRIREINTPWPIALVQRTVAWLGVSIGASFVAGLATGPFAIQHFNRMAAFGLPANLVTAPLTSFVLMPSLALGAVAEGAGLSAPALWLAGEASGALISVARWTAALPNAVLTIPSAPPIALAVAFLGVLFVCLWKGPLRWLGLPAAAAVSLWPRPEPPLAWIADEGANLAVVAGGAAHAALPDVRLFALELWSRRRGLPLADAALFECGRKWCRTTPAAPLQVALWRWRKAPTDAEGAKLCGGADLVIWRAEAPPPAVCRTAPLLDRAALAQGGAAEVTRGPDGALRLTWSQTVRGDRPWTR